MNQPLQLKFNIDALEIHLFPIKFSIPIKLFFKNQYDRMLTINGAKTLFLGMGGHFKIKNKLSLINMTFLINNSNLEPHIHILLKQLKKGNISCLFHG